MSELKKESDFVISVEDMQQTIRMDIQSGKISQSSLPPPPRTASVRNATRPITGFFRTGLLNLRYLFGHVESSKILINGSEINEFDTFTAVDAGEGEDFENRQFTRIDDNFETENLLASGGQANILSAKDKQIGRIVAVKRLREECKTSSVARSNLLQEAMFTARLEHPAIIPVYCLCSDDDKNLNIVMKKIRGKTLSKYLDEVRDYYEKNGIHIFDERASLARRLEIFLDICNGLSYAHNLRVVHCDLKPDNVMIGFYHETYIIDWGIAKTLNEKERICGLRQIAGTPRYIAPEVILGMDYDQRADVFAMGAILFEIVTLNEAFAGNSLKEILENICCGKIRLLKHRFGLNIDKGLGCIIKKATATNPEQRYRKIDDLADDIRRYRNGLEIMANPDNIFQYGIRWMLIHKRLMRWFFQILLLMIFGLGGCNIYNKMQYELQQKRRETALNSAYTKSLIVSNEINNKLNEIEQIASVLASETGFILDHHPFEGKMEDVGVKPLLFSAAESMGEDAPPAGSFFSNYYNAQIDFGNISYENAGNVSQAVLDYYCYTLLPFRRQIISFFILSCYDKAPFTGEAAYLPENMANSNYSLLRLNLNFADGVMLRYPAAANYGKLNDFRKSSCYLAAVNRADRVVWDGPYLKSDSGGKIILTAAKAIVTPAHKFLGVASADIPLDEISRIIDQNPSDRYFKKMLILDDGSVLINTANPLSRPKNNPEGELILPKFYNLELFELIKKKKFGFELVQENGREAFYVYSYLEQMKWYYVVRIDQESMPYQKDWKKAETAEYEAVTSATPI